MTDKTKKFYNRIYRNSKKSVFENPEEELLRLLRRKEAKTLKRGLDLGSGDGRNALFLAKKGYDVDCIDNSIEGLRKIRNQIKNRKLKGKLHLIDANLKNIVLEKENYNLIICVRTFHEIGKKATQNIIKQMKNSTGAKGINYLSFFIHRKGTYMKKNCYYPNESEILKQYTGWKIIRKIKCLETHSHPLPESCTKRIKHDHYICHLILKEIER